MDTVAINRVGENRVRRGRTDSPPGDQGEEFKGKGGCPPSLEASDVLEEGMPS
jgi:hypothetical protein